MKEQNNPGLKSLFASLIKIGCIGFGGGSALIPVIEREVVEDKKMISEDEYNKDVVVACITPGALPVEISVGIGKRIGGIIGMIGGGVSMTLPGVTFTLIILTLLSVLGNTLFKQIQFLSIGLGSFICCLLTAYIISSLKVARSRGAANLRNTVIIMLIVFTLTCGKNIFKIFSLEGTPIFGLSTVNVLIIAFFWILFTHCHFSFTRVPLAVALIAVYLLCVGKIQLISSTLVKDSVVLIMAVLAIWGLYQSIIIGGSGEKVKNSHNSHIMRIFKEVISWLLFIGILSIPAFIMYPQIINFLANGFGSSLASFGGGDAYITIADGIFVEGGSLTESQFYNYLVPIVNILPGSILCKTLTGISYYLGFNLSGSVVLALVFALSGFAVSVAASGIVFCVIYHVYDNFEEVEVFQMISRWIRPIISGLLLNVLLSMFYSNLSAGSTNGLDIPIVALITLFITGLNLYLLYAKKKSNLVLIIVSAALGLLICNVITQLI